jgi:hypothetical protein
MAVVNIICLVNFGYSLHVCGSEASTTLYLNFEILDIVCQFSGLYTSEDVLKHKCNELWSWRVMLSLKTRIKLQ